MPASYPLFSVAAKILQIAAPQVAVAKASLSTHYAGMSPVDAAASLERSLRRQLVASFGLAESVAAESLRAVPCSDAELRRDALLQIAAVCVVLEANGLTHAFS
jgi:hypothetical protein